MSRSSKRVTASGVSEVGNSTPSPSGLDSISTGKPLSRNISIIRRFEGITSARKVAMPLSPAVSARWASRIVPSPRPWKSSATANATSAVLGSISR